MEEAYFMNTIFTDIRWYTYMYIYMIYMIYTYTQSQAGKKRTSRLLILLANRLVLSTNVNKSRKTVTFVLSDKLVSPNCTWVLVQRAPVMLCVHVYEYSGLRCFAVSENKVLCHPSSVDSLTTSAGTEDHVSMGGFSARKCVTVVEHVEHGL